MRGNTNRSRRTVAGTAAASAAAMVALVLGPAGGAGAATAGSPARTAGETAQAGSLAAAAAADYFLKIDGIVGDSVDRRHQGEIDIESFSWGVSNPATVGSPGTGAGAGKASVQDMHVTALFGKASPQLFQACATGKHFPTATLTARKAGRDQQEFLKIEMKDVLVSSYQTGGSDSTPTDQFSLSFASATFRQVPPPAPAP